MGSLKNAKDKIGKKIIIGGLQWKMGYFNLKVFLWIPYKNFYETLYMWKNSPRIGCFLDFFFFWMSPPLEKTNFYSRFFPKKEGKESRLENKK